MRSLILVAVLVVLSLSLVSADVGIGLHKFRSEVVTYVDEKACIEYGLFNPFNTDVIGYLDVSGEILTIYDDDSRNRRMQLDNISQQLIGLRTDYATRNLTELEELDIIEKITEFSQLKTELEGDLQVENLKKGVELPAGTLHYDEEIVEVCFLGTERGIYYGEVLAKTIRNDEVKVTGSAVAGVVSASLKVIVMQKRGHFARYKKYYIVAAILTLLVALFIAKWKKKQKMIQPELT